MSKYKFSIHSKWIVPFPSSRKIMVVLHGRGDSLRPFLGIHEELRLGGMNYLLLNARRRYYDGYSWYAEPPSMRYSLVKARHQVSRVLDQLTALGFKAGDIFLLGYSQGGLLCSDVALHYPHALGGVIVVSGYFHFFPRWRKQISDPQRLTPWLVIHGKDDDILPINETEYGVKKLVSNGMAITWKVLAKDHSMDEVDARLIRQWCKNTIK